MGNMLRSFRTQMIIRLCMSMATAGGITYGLYKILQFYYQKEVKAEDPLAQVRLKIAEIGDINFFLIIFIPLAIVFFFFSLNLTVLILKRFLQGFINWQMEILIPASV